jgi:hypothetical protein
MCPRHHYRDRSLELFISQSDGGNGLNHSQRQNTTLDALLCSALLYVFRREGPGPKPVHAAQAG